LLITGVSFFDDKDISLLKKGKLSDDDYGSGYMEPYGFVNNYEVSLSGFRLFISGLSQLIDGGAVTNPKMNQVSYLQNKGRFPNIVYDASVLSELKKIHSEMGDLIKKIPDISDIMLFQKLRNVRDFSYVVEELPKNPLDLSFVNRSKNENLYCSLSSALFGKPDLIPVYLFDSGVRFFGVVAKGIDSKGKDVSKRIGLTVGFESEIDLEKVLVCYSPIISRRGYLGSHDSFNKIYDFVEDWLIDYGSLNGFSGVAMHYDRGVESKHSADFVNSGIVFRKSIDSVDGRLYGSFFEESSGSLIFKPGSCYWLKRPN
jgi:hypothetical protein